MSDYTLTDELKQMNVYWRLLAGLVNEGLGVVGDERRSPEERLEWLREKLEFARRYMRVLPPSVRAELDANPRMQATMAEIRRQANDPHPAGSEVTWVRGEDGDFHEVPAESELGE